MGLLPLILLILASAVTHGVKVEEILGEGSQGIHVVDKGKVCFPSNHWMTAVAFPFSDFKNQFTIAWSAVQTSLNKFKATGESTDEIEARSCQANEKTEGVCDAAKMTLTEISVSGVQDKKQALYYDTKEVLKRFENIGYKVRSLPSMFSSRIEWSSYPESRKLSKFITSHPLDFTTMVHEKKEHVSFLPLIKPFSGEGIKEFVEILGTVAHNVDMSVLGAYVTGAQNILDSVAEKINQLEDLLHEKPPIDFPLSMIENGLLDEFTEFLKTEFSTLISTDDMLSNFLVDTPLTEPIQSIKTSSTGTKEENIHFVTSIPLIFPLDVFELKQAVSLPFAKENYVGKVTWKKKKVKYPGMLTQQNKNYYLKNVETDLQCSEFHAQLNCSICSFMATPIEDPDECMQEIFKSKEPKSCTEEEVDEPEEQAQKVSDNQWTFTDPNPGTLTVACRDGSAGTSLPHSGMITFMDNCSYNIVDGPFQHFLPSLPSSVTAIKSPTVINTVRKITEDLTNLQLHFKKYGYIYLMSILGLLATIILVLSGKTYINCRRVHRGRVVQLRRNERESLALNETRREPRAPPARSDRPYINPLLNLLPSISFEPEGIRVRDIV